MLREDGIVYDDGTTSRLADDHYFVTTTTAKAGQVMQHLEFCRQVLLPELDVQLPRFPTSGRSSRSPARGRVTCCASSSIRWKTLQRRLSRSWALREVALRAASVRGFSASPFPASWPSRFRFRRALATRCRQSDAAPASRRRHALWHRGTRRHAHREGPRRRQRTQRHDDGRRPRPRQDESTKKDFVGRVWPGARRSRA